MRGEVVFFKDICKKVSNVRLTQNYIYMAKSKKTSRRLSKKDIVQQLLELFEQNPAKDFKVRELFQELHATNHPQKMLMLDVIDDLILNDYIARDDRGNYRYAVRSQVMEGTFVRKRNGRNSFVPDDGGQSILVTERNSSHALDGDRVRVTMLARRQGHTREAVVTEVLESRNDSFVGELKVDRNFAFLITNSRSLAADIFIPKKFLKGGKTGDKAVVKIVEWPQDSKSPIGKVVDILGHQGENNAEMCAILAEYNLPYSYPEKVELAADNIPVEIPAEEIKRREDFRDAVTFTIDPRDAKDFDDAISIRRISGKGLPLSTARPKTTSSKAVWEVGVHIADVSYYVKEGDIIDREAYNRATSVYLVDRTIPMLPEKLCNQLCSLRQDEEKVAYSTIFHINERGEVLDWHLAHTVIRSNRRFTYEEVQYILEHNGEASAADLQTPGDHPEVLPEGTPLTGEFAEELVVLNRLAKLLRDKRFKNGAIGFDRPEVRFEIDDKGHPISTYLKIARDANKLVEEFMLLANRSVAESIGKVARGKKPKTFVYRIHDVPDPEKLEKLNGFIGRFGYKLRTEGSKQEVSKSLNQLLEDVHNRPEENMVEMVALRAMMKARYSIHNIGHYGLMFDYYTHFTSPIRRYPDLMVHRLLTRYAEGGRSANGPRFEEFCEHASAMEQLAETAERASIKYKQIEFMGDRLGEEFDGVIDGVTEFGLYVEITENGCEGMIPLRCLEDDYYEFDEKNFCLIGRRFRKRYALGDKVRICVERANLDRRQLDFSLVETEEQKAHPAKSAKPAAKSASRPAPQKPAAKKKRTSRGKKGAR